MNSKYALRRAIQKQRSERVIGERVVQTQALTLQLQQLLSQYSTRTFACYLPLSEEPDTSIFVEWSYRNGYRIALPIVQPRQQLTWGWYQPEQIHLDSLGIPTPSEATHLTKPEVDSLQLFLVPALAVDHSGVRLGKGQGFYDRFFAHRKAADSANTTTYAVVFPEEVLPVIPADSHDVTMDGAVTYQKILTFPEQPQHS